MAATNATDSLLPPDTFTINNIPNTQTCATISVSWSYTLAEGTNASTVGPLAIALFGYTDPGEDPADEQDPENDVDQLMEVIASNVSISGSPYSLQVNVPAGEYQIVLQDQFGDDFGSTPFNVSQGDMSCLGPLSTWTTPASLSTSGATSSSSGSHLSRGAIAGIVIGVVAAVVALLVLLVMYARKRRIARLASRDRRGWTSLNSLKAPLPTNDAAEYPRDMKVNPTTPGVFDGEKDLEEL